MQKEAGMISPETTSEGSFLPFQHGRILMVRDVCKQFH